MEKRINTIKEKEGPKHTSPSLKKVIKKEYHPNGNLKSEKTYLNGKLHGTSRFYNRDGTIWAIQRSKNGIKESMEFWSSENKNNGLY